METIAIILSVIVIKAYNELGWPIIEKVIDRVDAKSKEKAEEVERE